MVNSEINMSEFTHLTLCSCITLHSISCNLNVAYLKIHGWSNVFSLELVLNMNEKVEINVGVFLEWNL